MQMIFIELNDYEFSNLILIIFTQLYGLSKYFFKVKIICLHIVI